MRVHTFPTHLFGCLALFALLSLATAAPAAAAAYSIDPVHSSAVFKLLHYQTANFYGMLRGVTGTVVYDSANPGASSIDVSIAADGVDTGNEQRDGHIMSPDFLNAKQFPAITFKSKSVTAGEDGHLHVVGDLNLHGVTNEITIMATKTGEGKNPRSGKEIIGFETRFSIDRSDYDMNYMQGPLSDEIEFLLSIEASQ